MMAFLYNVVKKSSAPSSDPSVMWMSLAIFLSYLVSDPLLNLSLGVDMMYSYYSYSIWAICDLFLLVVILLIAKNKSIKNCPAKLYLSIGLTVNMLLFIGMHIDVSIVNRFEPWWFWKVYSVTVNIMDVMMIIALLCNKDFLGLVRGYNRLRGLNKH
ncbi:hypothetical protein H5162_13905 [Pseudoalteromonas sp. SR41-8]|uniref:hypothetical protein n=1 Tax=Pseudoalteromonas sp. SR41-8 TaxID=2760946 RepID=UPI0015FFABAE|nr:hypothetical protein [Pseudoalteromonas sp. SR41-8]MBB1310519.1 hypothetical protein [Pseudoalteromonas sp. SR41-8]